MLSDVWLRAHKGAHYSQDKDIISIIQWKQRGIIVACRHASMTQDGWCRNNGTMACVRHATGQHRLVGLRHVASLHNGNRICKSRSETIETTSKVVDPLILYHYATCNSHRVNIGLAGSFLPLQKLAFFLININFWWARPTFSQIKDIKFHVW